MRFILSRSQPAREAGYEIMTESVAAVRHFDRLPLLLFPRWRRCGQILRPDLGNPFVVILTEICPYQSYVKVLWDADLKYRGLARLLIGERRASIMRLRQPQGSRRKDSTIRSVTRVPVAAIITSHPG
jgi:hypothetical protein